MNQLPQPIQYSSSTTSRRSGEGEAARALIFSALLLPASLLVASGGLHNEHPLLIFWPFAGGWVAYLIWRAIGTPRHRGLNARGSVATAIVFWLLSATLAGLGLYQQMFGVDPHVLTYEYNTCANHLRIIGQALNLDAEAHQGKYPAKIDDALEFLYDWDPTRFHESAKAFVCPSTTDTPTSAPTTRAAISGLTAGGHFSYVYLGAGLKLSSPKGTVLMYEPTGHHPHMKTIAVLYTDGTAENLEGASAQKFIAAIQAGENPPMISTKD